MSTFHVTMFLKAKQIFFTLKIEQSKSNSCPIYSNTSKASSPYMGVQILSLLTWMLLFLYHSIISKCSKLTDQFSWKEETQIGLRVFLLDLEYKYRDYLLSERLVQVIVWLLLRSKESKDKASVNVLNGARQACMLSVCRCRLSLLILVLSY